MYDRIKTLSDTERSLVHPELVALAKVWHDRRKELESSAEFTEFIKRLRREWAIETGIIERLYQWDRGVTEVLIIHGIDATVIAHRTGLPREKASNIANLIEDQLATVEGLFQFVKDERSLSEHYIRSLHQQLTAHQDTVDAMTTDGKLITVPLLKGEYKRLPNNPRRSDGAVHEYSPPEFVADEMQALIKWYHDLAQDVPPEVLSAFLHHRFTQIHPFQDGNGRVARALASLVFLKAGLFPFVTRDSDREAYIECLESADNGDMQPLLKLFVARQRDALLQALGIEQQVKQARHADQILASALQLLKDKGERREAEVGEGLAVVCSSLFACACTRVEEIASKLRDGFAGASGLGEAYRAVVRHASPASPHRHYHYHQVVRIAQQFRYFANLDRYRSWVKLEIHTGSGFEYVISFHAYGHGVTGVVAVSAFTSRRVPREEGGTDLENVLPACTDLFQFNYAEPPDSVERRFAEWLESSLAIGLAEWRHTLSS
ncbi:MAG: Fic family protein [Candidatus Riflebacteria bacterium]|nr:Fic family protein [Candidatus Riflebacteria bacterium]